MAAVIPDNYPSLTVLVGTYDDGSLQGVPTQVAVNADGALELAGTITLDPTNLATGAKQDTAQTTLDATLAAVLPPTKYRAITPSDSTDITAIASKGLYVSTDGDVVVKGTGDSAAVTLAAQTAGTFIPGSFKRVMVATTATVVGCS